MEQDTILIVDDELRVRQSLERILKSSYTVLTAAGGSEALSLLQNHQVDVVVLDFYLLDAKASDLLPKIRRNPVAPEVIIISGKANTKKAVNCLKDGAFDFLIKPYVTEELLVSINNALNKKNLEKHKRNLLDQSIKRFAIIGSSPGMLRLKKDIALYANSSATVLIGGETGTGKELIANQLHYLSPRAAEPLQVINCAAVPKELADSELFGHTKGAFTGAISDKPGKVEIANKGSLFLDEIGEMPLELQAKLLRFLENKEFERIGENKVRCSDVRVIAATHRDLPLQVQQGKFRQDLFYRLNVCSISAPPLDEHREDIRELVENFSRSASINNNRPLKKFSDDAISYLMAREWPGNIRQLKNMIEQAVIYFPDEIITAQDLQNLHGSATGVNMDDGEATLQEILEKTEMEIIRSRIAKFDGKMEKAALSLGIHRSSLHRKMNKNS